MYYVMRASAPSLHRESTDSLIMLFLTLYIIYEVLWPIALKCKPLALTTSHTRKTYL